MNGCLLLVIVIAVLIAIGFFWPLVKAFALLIFAGIVVVAIIAALIVWVAKSAT